MIVRRKPVTWAFSLLSMIVLPWLCWQSAALRGKLSAHLDLMCGYYRILGYGLPPPWLHEYARLLRTRYGVEYRPVAGCVVSRPLLNYVDGYDEVSAAAINRKFRRDVFTEISEEAKKKGNGGQGSSEQGPE